MAASEKCPAQRRWSAIAPAVANEKVSAASRDNSMARVLIGTSGWHYDSWRGPFFPKGLPIKSQLQYYASQFQTAELNGVFYRTPTPEAVRSWREQTGNDFVFAWKASKFITHWKSLSANSVNSLELLEDRLSLLGGPRCARRHLHGPASENLHISRHSLYISF
jgi:hypothetical protein